MCSERVLGGIYHILEKRSLVKITLIEANIPLCRVEWLQTQRLEKNLVLLRFHFLYLFNMISYSYSVQVRP